MNEQDPITMAIRSFEYLEGWQAKDGEIVVSEVAAEGLQALRALQSQPATDGLGKVREALEDLIDHTLECETELDVFHGMGKDAGAGCSSVVCKAQEAIAILDNLASRGMIVTAQKPTEDAQMALDFCDMVLEIGEPDDTIIPVWPIETEMALTHPLTVRMVRTIRAALARGLGE